MYCTVVLLFLAKFRFFLAEYLYNMHIQSPFTTFINFEIKKATKNLGPSHNNIYYARNVSEYIYKYRYIKRNFSQKLKVQFYVKCGYFHAMSCCGCADCHVGKRVQLRQCGPTWVHMFSRYINMLATRCLTWAQTYVLHSFGGFPLLCR
jgi:hypothetical protein